MHQHRHHTNSLVLNSGATPFHPPTSVPSSDPGSSGDVVSGGAGAANGGLS